MGKFRHDRPLTFQSKAFALKRAVKELWGRDSFSLADIKDLQIERDLPGFDPVAWMQSARDTKHLIDSNPSAKTRLWRFNERIPAVIDAAMEAGLLATKKMAQDLARDFVNKGSLELAAFCKTIAEVHPQGQEFTAGDVHVDVCDLLGLDQKVWSKVAISHLLVEMARLKSGYITHEAISGGGNRFRIVLASSKVSAENTTLEPVLVKVEKETEMKMEMEMKMIPQQQCALWVAAPATIEFLEKLVEVFGDKVIHTKVLGDTMGEFNRRWYRSSTYNNFLVDMRKTDILRRCTESGENPSENDAVRGYSRLNLDHPQVQQIMERFKPASVVEALSSEDPALENVDLASLTQPALEPQQEPQCVPELEETLLSFAPITYTQAELEEKIQQAQAQVMQDREERDKIAAQIRELQARDLELSQREPLRQQELTHLEQELARLEHAKQEAIREAAKLAEDILENLPPLVRQALKERLSNM